MKQTENYGFEKPDIKEFFKLETWKNNMDKIDEAIKERETAQKVTDEEIKKIKNVQFTQADERKNIESKETLPMLFGKIAKWLADLKKVAFTGSYNDLENKPDIPAAVAVKGNAEKNYRTGNVNLTPDDIGALPIGGGTLTGQLQVGEKVKIYTSSEGGNIQIISPDDIGLRWELDAFKGDLRFICFNNDGTVKKICQLTKDGTIIANNATQSAAGLMSPKDKEKLDNLSIVNNNTTTEAGYALDARQANPNVDGSLAKQISTLNSGLKKYYTQTEVDNIIEKSKVKSIVIEFEGVTTNESKAFFPKYTYWGYVGEKTTEIDNLIAQGHTILGGFICGGPHNDASMAGNGSDNIGVIVGSATYYNVPYSFYVFSQAYQTIRIKVCVLYI